MTCPLGIDILPCPDCPYSKDGLCDWPYYHTLTLPEIQELTEAQK